MPVGCVIGAGTPEHRNVLEGRDSLGCDGIPVVLPVHFSASAVKSLL